jgi:hypothetical protein
MSEKAGAWPACRLAMQPMRDRSRERRFGMGQFEGIFCGLWNPVPPQESPIAISALKMPAPNQAFPNIISAERFK